MNLNTQFRRVLYGSPLHRTSGKIALAAILIGMFVYAIPNFQLYYLTQPLAMAAALPLTVLIYLPTVLVLYFFSGCRYNIQGVTRAYFVDFSMAAAHWLSSSPR